MEIPGPFSIESIIFFAVFLIGIFIIYKLFKSISKILLAAAAGFAFPWVAVYISSKIGTALPVYVVADFQHGMYFAAIGAALGLIYLFSNLIILVLKVLTWPIRSIFVKKREDEMSQLKKEITKIKRDNQ